MAYLEPDDQCQKKRVTKCSDGDHRDSAEENLNGASQQNINEQNISRQGQDQGPTLLTTSDMSKLDSGTSIGRYILSFRDAFTKCLITYKKAF